MTSFSDNFIEQISNTGLIDVVGIPTDASISATGSTPATGMLGRDTTTGLVYARKSDGTWPDLYPLADADHGQLIGLTDDDHPQYHSFLKIPYGNTLGTATEGKETYLQNTDMPCYADGNNWMAETGGTEKIGLRSGAFYGGFINTSGAAFAGTGIQRAAPWTLSRRAVFDQILAHSTAAIAGSTFRPCIWSADVANGGLPGTLLLDGGTDISGNSVGDLVQTISGNITLDPGVYWLGGTFTGGPTLCTMNGANGPFALAMGADSFSTIYFAGVSRTVGSTTPGNPFGTPTFSATIPAVRLRAV